MKKQLFTAILAATVWATVPVAQAESHAEDAICLDCHLPAEDWEGMSKEDIIAKAMDPSIRSHKDNAGMSAEEMDALVSSLLAE